MGARVYQRSIGESEWRRIAIDSKYCVNKAAKLSGLSPRHFYRQFVFEMDCSPKKWFKVQQLEFGRSEAV